MRVLAIIFAAFMTVLAVGSPAFAQQPEESTYVPPLADATLEARAKSLQRELRCLVCQGQSIDESNSALAADLRRLIRQQIQGGQSDDEIKNFLVARYGAFVLMKPPVRQDTFFSGSGRVYWCWSEGQLSALLSCVPAAVLPVILEAILTFRRSTLSN